MDACTHKPVALKLTSAALFPQAHNKRGPPSPTSPVFSPHFKSPNEWGPSSPTSPVFSPHFKSPNEWGPSSPTTPAFSPQLKSPNERVHPHPLHQCSHLTHIVSNTIHISLSFHNYPFLLLSVAKLLLSTQKTINSLIHPN